jgi:tetratricopeptide (TPR) repeat protein
MTEEASTPCANCGKAEEFEAKLKTCNACKLVKYCGRDCQIAHRPQHKNACKRRAAELRDEALFMQPPKRDDCPICFLLLPEMPTGKAFRACCGKRICMGCAHEHELQSNGSPTCPFCRADTPSAKEHIKMLEKRVDANDANAIYQLGNKYFEGDEVCGIKKDVDKAVKLFHSAAELGCIEPCGRLGVIYDKGEGAIKDKAKAMQYCEKGAMAGCVISRINLGINNANVGSFDRAIKHWLIAASCGDIRAVDLIKKAMAMGSATIDHYAQALRGYEQYLEEVKSSQRDRAAAYSDEYKYLYEA